jgi:anti-sigma-K factor RskA
MDHEVYKEMLALDALGVLEEADRDALAEHLQTCAECRGEDREMHDLTALLVHTVAPVAPPAALRARLLETISSSEATTERNQRAALTPDAPERASESAPDLRAEPPAQTEAKTEGGASVSSKVLPFESARGERKIILSRSAFAFGAIAASLVVVALAATLLTLWTRNNQLRQELAQVSARAEELSRRTMEAQSELARERETRELLTAPEMNLTVLAGTEAAPRAQATIVYDRSTGRALLLADKLPPTPPGKAYQLWFIEAGRPPMPGKVFTTDAAGQVMMRDQVPADAARITVFAVTLEPAQGVAAPTGDKILLGNDS